MSSPSGQLSRVDQSSGSLTPIGLGLASLGWALPADGCSPSAIDTTGKWIYVLARNGSAAAAPWWALGVELADGTVRKAYALPAAYPPALRACEHALSADGSWHGYISAITRDSAPRLLITRCTFTWPASNECDAVADLAVLPLGLGSGAATPMSAATNSTLWVSLAGGLVGVGLDAAQRAPPRLWPLPAQASIVGGLLYDVAGAQRVTYFLMQTAAGAVRLARFVDTGVGALEVGFIPGAAPSAPVAPNFVALLTDKKAMAFLSGAGALVTIDLEDTSVVGEVDAWCGGAEAGGESLACPLLIEYQPFVF